MNVTDPHLPFSLPPLPTSEIPYKPHGFPVQVTCLWASISPPPLLLLLFSDFGKHSALLLLGEGGVVSCGVLEFFAGAWFFSGTYNFLMGGTWLFSGT